MKIKNLRKFLSAAAVLAISATAAISVVPLAGCLNNDTASDDDFGKLITEDANHNLNYISTATGTVQTKSSGKTYYVAPDGVLGNDGSSWDKATSIADLLRRTGDEALQPGDTVYVKPGTYSIQSMVTVPATTKGEYNKYIRIVNAALEKEASGYTGSETIATLDFSQQYFASDARGVQIYGSYIYWYGIDVCGAGDNGLYVGGSYNTIEYCEFYNNRDTGLQLGRIESGHNSIDQWPSYNLIKNCTSHNNYDNETYGENADGFAAKLTVGYGNVFDGCIAYRNSDDGWDLYAKTDSGNIGCVIIYNCVAFENGYLEYTQKECNDWFGSSYNTGFNEANTNSYKTRDGDGNGFKLGGSVMEGDVVMYNCLSFHNRMHGVTDNSNPGFLKVEGVTSYDNSAAVDDNPESSTFGEIIKAENHDTHSNIDVARQTYSYNTVINTLSVSSGVAVSLDADAYRGSVTNSVLYAKPGTNVIKGSLDADTKTGIDTYTEQRGPLVAADIFKQLPIVYNEDTPTYNISGLNDLYANGTSGALKSDRVHVTYRNADMSINMKNILAKNDGIDDSLISGQNIGSTLNLSSWGDYTHFFKNDLVDGMKPNQDEAQLARAIETLTINTDSNAVYQDFEVPVKMNNCKISWSSDNSGVVAVGTDVEVSGSTSQYITMLVYRPLPSECEAGKDYVTVKLTATIESGEATGTKEFILHVKSGVPTIGAIKVITEKGEIVADGGSYVVDQYAVFKEPEVQVENGIDYNGKLLKSDQYTYTTSYRYATDKNVPSVQIKGFTPSNAGVYTVTKTVTLKSDGSQKSMTYTIYVASQTAQVDFINQSSNVSVNKDGYMISGNLSNATGMIYAVSSVSELNVTAENIKTQPGVESYNFRSDAINFQFTNSNNSAYHVYFALANLNGEITSEVYDASIGVVNVSTTDDFMKLAGGSKIGEEDPQTTVYILTNDLDFSGVSYSSGTSGFTGVFNGSGYTIKNVTLSGNGIFYKVQGGTIENVKFDNIKITNSTTKTGIVSQSYGGYYHNIAITNLLVSALERTGGLIGQVYEGSTYISQVSIVNPTDANTEYHITSAGSHRAGGLIGLIQTASGATESCLTYISDCYVMSNVSGSQQIGGMVGAYDNAKANLVYDLVISRCYFNGTASSTYATPRVGGIIGYQSGNVGIFTITGCISVGKLVNQGNDISVALKTASLIVGGYSSAAINVVNNCIATMQEYNSDYQVEPYSEKNLQSGKVAIEEILGNDCEDKWSFVYADGSTSTLQAPYLTLKFLDV